MADPFGRALRDHHRGERTEPLVARFGTATMDHPVEAFYFEPFTGEDWWADALTGPLVDIGAGAGRHALYFQERFETVAVEVSDALVTTMRERGVDDARRGDLFALRESFERDRFASALCYGTQLGLAASMQGLRRTLGDLAFVTGPDATAVVDGYDPTLAATSDLLGYRGDPTPGLAFRQLAFAYEGEPSEPLLFRLFSPDRLREACVGTGWTVRTLRHDTDDEGTPQPHYVTVLAKA